VFSLQQKNIMSSNNTNGPPSMKDDRSPILAALQSHQLSAEVCDLDLYRVGVGMLAVECDYIVSVKCLEEEPAAPTTTTTAGAIPASGSSAAVPPVIVEPFCLSKSYSAFRSLASQLKRTADLFTSSSPSSRQTGTGSASHLPREAVKCAKYCELVSHLVESQKTQYLGKVNYGFVKGLARQRSRILNDVLDATCSYFPEGDLDEHPLLRQVAVIIENFFLTDHCDPTDTGPGAKNLLHPTRDVNDADSHSRHGKKHSFDSQHQLIGALSKGLLNLGGVGGGGGNSSRTMSPSRTQGRKGSKGSSASSSHAKSVVIQPLSTKARRSDSELREKDEVVLTGIDHGPDAADNAAAAAAGASTDPVGSPFDFQSPVRTRRAAPATKAAAARKSVLQVAATYTPFGSWYLTNPTVFLGVAGVVVYLVYQAGAHVVSVDGDMALLTLFAAFCLGLHVPRPPSALDGDAYGYGRPAGKGPGPPATSRTMRDTCGRMLYKRMSVSTPRSSVLATAATSAALDPATMAQLKSEMEAEDGNGGGGAGEDEEMAEDHEAVLGSPLPLFPPGAKIGSHTNCYSEPDPGNFSVRGPNYFADKKKIGSDEFLFPTRGIDLFLTDTCPENVGSNSSVFGGSLRDEPTFIINFRLPWGVLVFYFRIPDLFIPFVKAGHDPNFDKTTKLPPLNKMSPGERTVCRFLLGDAKYKNETLKIVPVVVDGPWVVKSVVGGKPAIIGTKLPVTYVYQPPEGNKQLYLEVDLDIAASSAARGILSVARSYTQILTLDLGFVVQSNKDDELPEQMLVGIRIHGVDPLNAPALPPMKNLYMNEELLKEEGDDEDASVTPMVMTRE
jgi:Protein ENHANCED DISEASE RESISTANCE 2, C-terminal